VKYNNDKSRDYTNPTLPTGDPNLDAFAMTGGAGVLASPFQAMHGLASPLTAAYGSAPVGGGAADFILPSPGMPLGGFTLPGAAATGLGPAAMRLSGQPSSGSVLLVSNLNEEVFTEMCIV